MSKLYKQLEDGLYRINKVMISKKDIVRLSVNGMEYYSDLRQIYSIMEISNRGYVVVSTVQYSHDVILLYRQIIIRVDDHKGDRVSVDTTDAYIKCTDHY